MTQKRKEHQPQLLNGGKATYIKLFDNKMIKYLISC